MFGLDLKGIRSESEQDHPTCVRHPNQVIVRHLGGQRRGGEGDVCSSSKAGHCKTLTHTTHIVSKIQKRSGKLNNNSNS